jgi:hypothetical protein
MKLVTAVDRLQIGIFQRLVEEYQIFARNIELFTSILATSTFQVLQTSPIK